MTKTKVSSLQSLLLSNLGFAISIVSSLVMVPVGISYLGSHDFGVLLVLMALSGYIPVLDFGVTPRLISELPKCKNKQEQKMLWSTCTFFIIKIATAVSAIYSVFAMFFADDLFGLLNLTQDNPGSTLVVHAFLAGILARFMATPMVAYLTSASQLHEVKLAEAGRVVSVLAALLIAQYLDAGLLGVALSYCVLNLAITVMLYCRAIYTFTTLAQISQSNTDSNILARPSSVSLAFFLMSLAGMVIVNTDAIVIAAVLGPEKVSEYIIGQKFFFVAMAMLNIVNVMAWPKIAAVISTRNTSRVRSLVDSLIAFQMAAALSVSVILIQFGDLFLNIWLGVDRVLISEGLFLAFSIFCINSVFIGVTSVLNNSIGPRLESALLAIAEAVLNIGLTIVLLDKIGLLGAAIGTVAATLFTSYFGLPLIVKYRTNGAFNVLNRSRVLSIISCYAILFVFYEINKVWQGSAFLAILLSLGLAPYCYVNLQRILTLLTPTGDGLHGESTNPKTYLRCSDAK